MSKFNILFSGDDINDARTLCEYIDEFYHEVGVSICDVDLGKVFGVVQSAKQDFPYPIGLEKASPFKKIASFVAFFAAEKPIHTTFPEEKFGQLASQPNAIIATSLAIDSLEGAVIKCPKRGDIALSHRITLSKHYWMDLVAAVSCSVPQQHFRCLSLVFEALAYQANPEAAYPREI